MNILYALLLTALIYPAIGTILFAVVENSSIRTAMKITILTFGHPLLTGIIIWLAGSALNREIAEVGVLLVAGTLLRIPFSNRKYFSSVIKEPGVITIKYFSELLKRKSISWNTADMIGYTQSASRSLLVKPTELTITLKNKVLKFVILDKTTKVSL